MMKQLVVLMTMNGLGLALAQRQTRFLYVPYGWLWFLVIFAGVAGLVAAASYLYGRATRPAKARRYALASIKHVVIWVAIVLTLYPVIYLVGVSFNRNNALAAVPPREGNLLIRSGVIPDPATCLLFSMSVY